MILSRRSWQSRRRLRPIFLGDYRRLNAGFDAAATFAQANWSSGPIEPPPLPTCTASACAAFERAAAASRIRVRRCRGHHRFWSNQLAVSAAAEFVRRRGSAHDGFICSATAGCEPPASNQRVPSPRLRLRCRPMLRLGEKKSKLPLVLGILAVLLVLGMGGLGAAYWFVVRPMLEKSREVRNDNTEPAAATDANRRQHAQRDQRRQKLRT